MAFGTVSDPYLAAALWTGCGAFATAGGLLVAVVLMRLRLIRAAKHERVLAQRWNPLFAECSMQLPAAIPKVPRRDAVAFLSLWCRAQESLRGDAQAHLAVLAERAGARRLAHALLATRKASNELLAIIVLGHLRDAAVVPTLERFIASGGAMTSLCAAQALLRIDPARALPLMFAAAARRDDWPLPKVAAMLREADPARAAQVLALAIGSEAALARPGPGLARLVRLHGAAHAESVRPALLRVLERASDPEALAAALGTLWHPQDASIARRLARHEAWSVRVAAVKALGRLGSREDFDLVAGLLADESWWVRYRAAETLCRLPGSDEAALRSLRERLSDRFARDVLDQALADRAAA